MRRLLATLLGAFTFLLMSCANSGTAVEGQKPNIDSEKVGIKEVVDQFAQAWENKDVNLLSKIMAHDENNG